MVNSADPDQLASSEAKWSGSTLFAKAGYIRVKSYIELNFFWKSDGNFWLPALNYNYKRFDFSLTLSYFYHGEKIKLHILKTKPLVHRWCKDMLHSIIIKTLE